MSFESGVVLCLKKGGVSLLTVVREIYAEILVDRVRRVTEGLTNDEEENFRAGKGCVDQILTLKKIDEKAREKKT